MRALLCAVSALALAVPAVSYAQDADYPADDADYEVVDPSAPQAAPDYGDDYDYEDDSDADRDYDRDFGREMRDPEMQARMGAGMESMVDVLFEIPIGGLLNAAENMDPSARGSRRHDPRMTVGDMAARDNPNLRGDMRRTVRMMPQMMGVMADAMGEMIPVFTRAMDKVERDWDRGRRRY